MCHNAAPGPGEELAFMLLQTNSYVVPAERKGAHARLIQRFRQVMLRLGCDQFEVLEQLGDGWSARGGTGDARFVQLIRFRDRKHQQQVQAAEKADPAAQALIREFCELIDFPYQQQQGLFSVGFYSSITPAGPACARDGSGGHSTAMQNGDSHLDRSRDPVEPPGRKVVTGVEAEPDRDQVEQTHRFGV